MYGKEYADELCTIITCGFINKQRNKQGNRTRFVFDSGENSRNDFESLKTLLKSYSIDIGGEEAEPKQTFPFIVAKNDKVALGLDSGVVTRTMQPLQFLEGESEKYNAQAPCGAYIGGRATIASLKLYGPSMLYELSSTFNQRMVHDEAVVEAFWKDMTEAITTAWNIIDRMQHRITLVDSRPAVPGVRNKGKLFGSVHGMTYAINQNYGAADEGFNIEYALGPNTSKVASCIPCSIFMAAVETPASATHFGRGDFWNLPQDIKDIPKRKWEEYIRECYREGYDHLSDHGCKVSREETDTDSLPELFLEALTIPGKFSDRIRSFLGSRETSVTAATYSTDHS